MAVPNGAEIEYDVPRNHPPETFELQHLVRFFGTGAGILRKRGTWSDTEKLPPLLVYFLVITHVFRFFSMKAISICDENTFVGTGCLVSMQ